MAQTNEAVRKQTTETISIVVGIETVVMFFVLICAICFALALGRSLFNVTEMLRKVTELDVQAARPPASIISEIHELQERAGNMSAALMSFQKYVPRAVVQHLVRNKLEATVGLTLTQAVVFFLDITNFTALMQEHGPGILIQMMNELFEEFSSILVSNGATLDKYIGSFSLPLCLTEFSPPE